MKQLIQNIIHASPPSLSAMYSKELKELVKDMLAKNPRDRPGINSVLSRPVVRERITSFLNETMMHVSIYMLGCYSLLYVNSYSTWLS